MQCGLTLPTITLWVVATRNFELLTLNFELYML